MKKSLFLCFAAVYVASANLSAQTIYRIVGADGKVTFSDKPPASLDQGKVMGTGVGAAGSTTGASLPFELKQVVSKYPVTLYSAPKCAPCDAGRSLLTGRGVPFNERTVTTSEDGDYLQRLTGESSLPVVSIGGQRIRGFSDGEWSQYLDAAGYPKTSILPAAYRNAPPEPLVALQKTPSPKADEAAKPQPAESLAAPVPLNTPNPANPAGIQF